MLTRFKELVRRREGAVFSAMLHVLFMGWGILSFSARPLEAKLPEDFVPVDVISPEQLSQLTKGTKDGDKAKKGPLVEKVGDPKPTEDTAGKVTEKKEIVAASDKPPEPKPPEKKPEPPKPVEKKPEPPADQIGELVKKEQTKKSPEKKETKVEPKKDEKPKKERTFDQSKIAALLDKRDPTRQAAVGETLNANAGLGKPTGVAQKLTMSWVGALQAKIKQCWNVPAGVRDAENIEIRVYFELRKDGSVASMPQLLQATGAAAGPAIAESAIRAIQQCQPYNFLPQSEYVGGWDRLDITFSSRDLFR
jgi:outer membrane biosynthesis protein TonB